MITETLSRIFQGDSITDARRAPRRRGGTDVDLTRTAGDFTVAGCSFAGGGFDAASRIGETVIFTVIFAVISTVIPSEKERNESRAL